VVEILGHLLKYSRDFFLTDEIGKLCNLFYPALRCEKCYRIGPWLRLDNTEGKFFVTKFEFGGSFDMSLERDCHELKVTPNLELLVTFGMSLM
jgi:hypothetical protein